MTSPLVIKALEVRLRIARAKYEYRRRKRIEWSIKVARSAKLHHPDARKRAEGFVKKWGSLEGEEARHVHSLARYLAKLKPPPPKPKGEGISTPATAWNPLRRQIANWIIPELEWAHAHGWGGYVTSGFRSYQKQKELYEIYLRGGNIAAKPGQSNHEGYKYTRGAVDVTQPAALKQVLRKKPGGYKLIWAEDVGLADTVHFSGTGR